MQMPHALACAVCSTESVVVTPSTVAVDATGVAGATIQLVSLIVSKARAAASEEKSAAPEGGPSASRITEEMLAQKEAERSSGWLSLPTTVTVAEHEASV